MGDFAEFPRELLIFFFHSIYVVQNKVTFDNISRYKKLFNFVRM